MTLSHEVGDPASRNDFVHWACAPFDHPQPLHALAEHLRPHELALVVLMVSPRNDLDAILQQAEALFAGVPVIGCTTAGEINGAGYADNTFVAIGFASSHFVLSSQLIADLENYDAQAVADQMIRVRAELAEQRPDWAHEFNFILIDGLSTREDRLAADLAIGLGSVPLFGGSAGDGTRFKRTFVFHGGQIHRNAAVLTQFRTRCPVTVFKTDHLIPTERRLVVTGADPARRVVHEINAEPAAQEYARLLGKDPSQLTPFTFAEHPLVVRIGGQHHVRAIQRIAENGDLIFFSAIDEGLVLALAEPRDMVAHLSEHLATLAQPRRPAIIFAVDCVLRRIEAENSQKTGAMSRILRENRVVGFSTYGEQFNSIHVNQTMTGVAIYAPEES